MTLLTYSRLTVARPRTAQPPAPPSPATMADKAKGKAAKKGDIPSDAAAVTVTFTLTITATPAPTSPLPCTVFDHRFTFSLFSTTPTTTPLLSTWLPTASLSRSTSSTTPSTSPPDPSCLSPPSPLTFSSSIDLAVDRDLLLSLQSSTLPIIIDHRLAVIPPPDSSPIPTLTPDDLPSPSSSSKASKAKASPSPLPPKRKAGGGGEGEERKGGTGHPALDDLPFLPLTSVSLPLSALLCPPFHVAAVAGEGGTSFALPSGLSSLSVALHTGGMNPIHPSLLPSLLPLVVQLHSVSPLTPYPPPSPFRDVSLRLFLPSPSPPPLPLPTTFLPSSSLTFTPTTLPPTVTFLGLLPPSTLHSLATHPRAGVRVELHDRDDGRIPTPSELEEEVERRRKAAEEAQREEDARVKEEEKKKKKQPAIKSPTAKGRKPDTPPEPLDGLPPPAPPAVEVEVGPVYDERSNVYGVATLPLHDLFLGPLTQLSGVAAVSPVYPAAGVAMLAPATRSNAWGYTMVGYTVRVMHPLPAVDVLRGGLRYGRVVAVMEEGEGGGWSEVYEEVLRWNAKACGVHDGVTEGHGSWDWLDSVTSPPFTDDDVTPPPVEVDRLDDKPKSRERGSKSSRGGARPGAGGGKEVKGELVSQASAEVKADAAVRRVVRADHLTGVSVTDGKQRWVVLEGLAVGRAGAVALAAVRDRLMEAKRGVGRMRLLANDDLVFPSRLYAGTPLSLMCVRLQAPLSSLVTKASAVRGAGFLALSKLAVLSKGAVVKSLQQAWEGKVMLEEDEVKHLKEGCAQKERLDDRYGVQLAKREREARRAKRAQKEAEERLSKEQLTIALPPNPAPEAAPPVESVLPTLVPTEGVDASVPAGESSAVLADPPAPLEATVVAADALVVKKRVKQPQSAPSAVPQLPSLTYSTPAEYRECLRALREACHADPHHHYTFHLDYLHSSVPRWESKEEAEREERAKEKAKWLDARGFIAACRGGGRGGLFSEVGLLSEGERQREREERRRRKGVDELVEEAWQARVERVQRAREVRFLTQPTFPTLFDRSPPTSIHLSGVEEVAARRALEEKERDDWRRKLQVDDPCFHVLWRGQHHVEGERGGVRGVGKSRLFALEGLLKDEPVKAALRFEREGKEGGGRSLVVQPAPVSITNEGPWVSPQELQIHDTGRVEGQAAFVRHFTRHEAVYKRKVVAEKH